MRGFSKDLSGIRANASPGTGGGRLGRRRGVLRGPGYSPNTMFCLDSAASSLRIMASIEKSVGFLIALAGCCSWLAVPIIILL